MAIKLYQAAPSPFVRKVLVAAHERGVFDEIELCAGAPLPTKRDEAVAAHNPSGKIPCAVIDGGTPLFDSRVISAYFDSIGKTGTPLHPDGEERFAVMTLEALGDSILEACILHRYERMLRPEEMIWSGWLDAQWTKVTAGLDALEATHMDALQGEFHAGAIAIACCLGYLDLRFADYDWRGDYPKLAAWFAVVSKRPSMAATKVEG